MIRMHNSKLAKEVTKANGEARELREALEAKRCWIIVYLVEVIIDYKAFVKFKRGLETMRVTSHQFKY